MILILQTKFLKKIKVNSSKFSNTSLKKMEICLMEEKMKHLGKCKQGKGCIYIKSLNDINTEILSQMILISVDYIKTKYPQ